MKRMILGVAAALVLSAGQAAADGLPSRGHVAGAPEVAVPNWNGLYLGVGVGAGAVVHKDTFSETFPDYPSNNFSSTFDGDGGEGVFGTVTVGYDRVIRPGWVAGVFVDYDFGSSISTKSRDSEGFHASIDHDYSVSAGGRLGYLVNPSTLLYGTAGYTQTRFDFNNVFSGAEALSVIDEGSAKDAATFHGYFVGAGIETFLRPNWTLKLEYRFSQFGKETVSESDFSYPTEIDRETLEPSMHTARLVLSYKFGQHD